MTFRWCPKRNGKQTEHSRLLVGKSDPALSPQQNENNVVLQKTLTTLDSVAVSVGIMIGAGIFISPTGVYKNTGSVGMTLVAWTIGGCIALLGALSFVELGTTIPKSGGFYSYILEAFGPLLAFLTLWITLILAEPCSLAIRCLTFSEYVIRAIFAGQTTDLPVERMLAVSTLLLVTYINCIRVKTAAVFQIVLTFIKIGSLMVISTIGLVHLCQGNTDNIEEPFHGSTASPSLFATALLHALYAYDGWSSSMFFTEELNNPKTVLFRSVCISVPLVTLLYIMTNLSYLVVMTPQQISSHEAVAVTFGNITMSCVPWIMPTFVAISILGSMNGSLFAISRLTFAGARERHLPVSLAMIHVTRFTPIPAAIFNCICALIMLTIGDTVSDILEYTTAGGFIVFGVTVAGLIYLRWSKPEMTRPFKMPLISHIIFFGICIFVSVAPMFKTPKTTLVGVSLMLTGIPLYFMITRETKLKVWSQKYADKFTRLVQLLLVVVYPKDEFHVS
ncbi:Y+L amino acid transporter 2-like isoform X2 [Ptychodera flava]|uniref:Y+L amino acid transporter 2-like isoform X2 n=1 Tax=Ptychodera flava TaxID=63121 RepID=UPI00396A76DB